MKLSLNPDAKSLDIGFEVPKPGSYNVIIEEDIREFKNEETGKVSLRFPLRIIDERDEDNLPLNHFVPLGIPFGRKMIEGIIQFSGCLEMFNKQFPGDIEVDDPRVIDGIKAKLPGKRMHVEVKVEKFKDREQARVTKFSYYISKADKAKAAQTASAGKESPAKETSAAAPAGDGW